jgi:hypothetical protein
LKDKQTIEKKKKKLQEEKKEHEEEDDLKKLIEEKIKKEEKLEEYGSTLLEMLAPPDDKKDAKKGKDSDQEMADESGNKDEAKKEADDKAEGKEDSKPAEKEEKPKENPKPEESSLASLVEKEKADDAAKAEPSHPQVKLTSNENDAEIMKPAEVSDSEHIEDGEAPKEKANEEPAADAQKKDDEAKDKKMDDETAEAILEGALPPALSKADKTQSEVQLQRKREEQELLVQRALQKDKENLMRLKASIEGREQQREGIHADSSVSEQTQEIVNQDLEKLIKEEGEDIEFEFYYD